MIKVVYCVEESFMYNTGAVPAIVGEIIVNTKEEAESVSLLLRGSLDRVSVCIIGVPEGEDKI